MPPQAGASGTGEPSTDGLPLSNAGGSGSGGSPPGSVPGPPPDSPPSADCNALATDANVNWRESSLQTDQEIVECLLRTLGRPIGYGENTLGGYDPFGASQLTIITTSDTRPVEQQILEAISGEAPNWIVFDKRDFAEPFEIGMYRLGCSDAAVLTQLDASEAECRDYRQWCNARAFPGEAECLQAFFNVGLNDEDLPLANPVIGSNKTIDGRMSEAFFRFSGFAIGQDQDGAPTQTANNVILTHLSFVGAGPTEEHELDPDMIRSTGASRDIWIHKNDFDKTSDSAFDVQVGASGITISFNRLVDVARATSHGANDSHVLNEQTTTTLHHNAFVTRDAQYLTLGDSERQVPLLRAGTSHVFDNVFVNYRKDVVRLLGGASLLWESNAFVISQSLQEKDSLEDSLAELGQNLIRDIDDGSLLAQDTALWFADGQCNLNAASVTALTPASDTVANLPQSYSALSRATLDAQRIGAGQELVDYVSATAGKHGQLPFNSPLAQARAAVLARGRVPCL